MLFSIFFIANWSTTAAYLRATIFGVGRGDEVALLQSAMKNPFFVRIVYNQEKLIEKLHIEK